MANIEIKQRMLKDLIEISFTYIKPAGTDAKKDTEKTIDGGFFAKKEATNEEIKAQAKTILKELLEREKAVTTKETMEVSLG